MTLAIDSSLRGWSSNTASPAMTLHEKYEIVKEIGDGSFGSVCLGRTRSAGAQYVRRNTMVAIKTMKKSFDSFAQCMDLREVIFLRTLPAHPHLVPAYDIFLDPLSRKLHIAMEYMDGNLYQLMKSRDHKPLDGHSVKSILFQILSGLEHIHENNFFHRDIKPENILVTSSSAPESGHSFKRYSSLMTPPSTPPTYTIKLADFGLARETHSRVPYTTYVSTRWYRAPEVLLRAGEYSAPVDIWALGAMAVEIATLKPLFPGGNEVDQVWRVCEIMGSPGMWVNRQNQQVGGGEWKDGIKLAQKLGFSFPKMAPHSLDTILPSPQWPPSLARFVTWCLLWDPNARPTSTQALAHEYFEDAVDPLRPKASSASKLLGRKQSQLLNDSPETPHSLASKSSSWFRRSLGHRDSPTPTAHDTSSPAQSSPLRPLPVHSNTHHAGMESPSVRPPPKQRASWAQAPQQNVAPIPILPSIKPASPLQDASNAQASSSRTDSEEKASKKIGRQLSVNSSTNHYAEYHRQEAEKALTGASGLASPTASKESFFSHLRKRARRFSGKHQVPISPPADDLEANAGCGPWSNRGSMSLDPQSPGEHPYHPPPPEREDSGFAELDKVLQNVKHSLENPTATSKLSSKMPHRSPSNPALKRNSSLGHKPDGTGSPVSAVPVPAASRTRRSVRHAGRPDNKYETPDEEDELLDEVLASASKAATRLDRNAAAAEKASKTKPRPILSHVVSDPAPVRVPYLTPSPSKENHTITFGQDYYNATPSKAMDIPPPVPRKDNVNPQWPTPPDDENEWAASAAASIFAAAQAAYR